MVPFLKVPPVITKSTANLPYHEERAESCKETQIRVLLVKKLFFLLNWITVQHLRARDITMNMDETPVTSIGSCEASQTPTSMSRPSSVGPFIHLTSVD